MLKNIDSKYSIQNKKTERTGKRKTRLPKKGIGRKGRPA